MDKELPGSDIGDFQLSEKSYIDSWSKNYFIDPDIINNVYYDLNNMLEKLKKEKAEFSELVDLEKLVPYRERQKVVSNYTDEDIEYLMSKSDPEIVRKYDDIIETFKREAE